MKRAAQSASQTHTIPAPTLIPSSIGIDNNFTVTGAKTVSEDLSLAGLIDLCLAENSRRMNPYDQRLIRPFAVPALARLARRIMRS